MSVPQAARSDQAGQNSSTKTMQAEKQAGVGARTARRRVIKNNLWGRVSGALRMGHFQNAAGYMGVVVAAWLPLSWS